nr:hypothetical protein [Herbaspirillum sp. ASV7]
MKAKFAAVASLSLILAACASTQPANVVPMAGGQYRTTGIAETERDAEAAAVKAADATCAKQGKRPEVSDSKTKYKGVVSEDANRNINKAGELAASVGVWLPGLSGDDDYQVSLTFACVK